MQRYKLIKEYPNHKKGDIAIYNPEVCVSNFIWEGTTSKIPQDFQPDVNPEWFEKIELDFEILTLKPRNGSYFKTVDELFDSNFNKSVYKTKEYLVECFTKYVWDIHSVKRLSDGEIFTVGDEVIYNEIFPIKLKIKSIQLFNNEILIHKDCTMNTNKLSEISHFKQPLFTTEDGVDIYEGDKYYPILFNSFEYKGEYIAQSLNKGNNWINPCSCKVFSTKEKAEEYILMNKPQFCLNDFIKERDLYYKVSSEYDTLNFAIIRLKNKIK